MKWKNNIDSHNINVLFLNIDTSFENIDIDKYKLENSN